MRRRSETGPEGSPACRSGWTGKDYYRKLKLAVEAAGIRVITHSPAKRLIIDHNDRVVGIEVGPLPTSDDIRATHQDLYRKVNPLKTFNSGKAEEVISKCRALEHRHRGICLQPRDA